MNKQNRQIIAGLCIFALLCCLALFLRPGTSRIAPQTAPSAVSETAPEQGLSDTTEAVKSEEAAVKEEAATNSTQEQETAAGSSSNTPPAAKPADSTTNSTSSGNSSSNGSGTSSSISTTQSGTEAEASDENGSSDEENGVELPEIEIPVEHDNEGSTSPASEEKPGKSGNSEQSKPDEEKPVQEKPVNRNPDIHINENGDIVLPEVP